MIEPEDSFQRRLKEDKGIAYLREDVHYFKCRLAEYNELKAPGKDDPNYGSLFQKFLEQKKDLEGVLERVFTGLDLIAQDQLKDRYLAIRNTSNRLATIQGLERILGQGPFFHSKEEWKRIYYSRGKPEAFVQAPKQSKEEQQRSWAIGGILTWVQERQELKVLLSRLKEPKFKESQEYRDYIRQKRRLEDRLEQNYNKLLNDIRIALPNMVISDDRDKTARDAWNELAKMGVRIVNPDRGPTT